MSDGAVIQIAPDTESEIPLHVVFVSDANAAKGVAHLRNVIVAGRHSKATVIESYVSLGDSHYFTNAVTEVKVDAGATLTHYKIQRESQRAYHVHTIDVQQQRDSHYVSFSFATGAALSRTNIYTNLDGEGCGATLNGLYMADGEQHVDHQTNIVHSQPNCFSREIYKGILSGSAHGVFNGKVYVYPIAQKTDGKQTNNNLLLSERARIDTKPQLEIYRGRRALHAWRDRRSARRDGALLHEEPRRERRCGHTPAHVRVRGGRARDDRGGGGARGARARDARAVHGRSRRALS